MIGETIGNFRVVARIGAGGMGEVFVAEQKNIETKVAIKVLRPEISVDRGQVDRFFNEARAVSRIKHAGTVKIFDVGFHSTGHAYLVMEFLEGETLAARIQRTGRLPLAQISDIGRQTAGVLEATHAAGITHRDLKPDNIFLVPDSELASRERVKILDFGIAKLTGTISGGAAPKTMGTMGTPAYMAPEQWGDASKVDWRADIYSLGCLAFEMATGRPPFIATNFAEACGKHLGEAPPKLRAIVPSAPEPLETMIDAMLAKSVYGRPPLREIAKTFEQLGSGLALGHDETLPPGPRPVRLHSPTPLEPVAGNAPTVASSSEIPKQATSTALAPRRRSLAPLYAVGGLVVVGGTIAAIVAASSSGSKNTAIAPIDAAVPTVDTAPADTAPAIRSGITFTPDVADLVKPEFVSIDGLYVMPKQATRGQFATFYAAVGKRRSEGFARALAPLKDWSDYYLHAWPPTKPDEPIAWATVETAREFCFGIGARLPTKEEWLRLSKGSWRIGTPQPNEIVFREWTSTVTNDGLAIVMGGTIGGGSTMTDAQRIDTIKNPVSKDTMVTAGTRPLADSVAAASIGIRCVKSAPKPGSKCDDQEVRAAETKADDAVAAGSYTAALAGLEHVLECKPDVLQKVYLVACRAKSFPRAKQLFEQLGRPQNLAQGCMKEGFDPRKPAVAPLPAGPAVPTMDTFTRSFKALDREYHDYTKKHGYGLDPDMDALKKYLGEDHPLAEQLQRIDEFRARLKPKD